MSKTKTTHEQTMAQPTIGHHPTMTIEVIGPDAAQLYLDSSHERQRNAIESKILRYAEEMRRGLWYEPPYTYSTIAFDSDGRLVNGQHRMRAIVEADVSLAFLVIRGVRTPASLPIPEGDQGTQRAGSFVTGQNDKDWQVAKALAEHGYTDYRMLINPVFVAILDMLGDTLSQLPVKRVKIFGVAPLRAAFAWSMVNKSPDDAAAIAAQYMYFTGSDLDGMAPALKALWKHLTLLGVGQSGGSRATRRDMFVKTLYAINNPSSKITCRNLDKVMADYRDDFCAVMNLYGF